MAPAPLALVYGCSLFFENGRYWGVNVSVSYPHVPFRVSATLPSAGTTVLCDQAEDPDICHGVSERSLVCRLMWQEEDFDVLGSLREDPYFWTLFCAL